MLKKFVATLLWAVCAVVALTSCGSSKASGTGEFTTVQASATPGQTGLDSDVAKWTGTPCQSAAAPITPDDVIYTIITTIYPTANTGQTNTIAASPLIIRKITLTLTPADTATPALPPQFQTQFLSAGQLVPPGASTDIPIRIASDALKIFLATGLGTQSINCSNPGAMLKYYADVYFDAVEVNTDRAATIAAKNFLVTFADFQ